MWRLAVNAIVFSSVYKKMYCVQQLDSIWISILCGRNLRTNLYGTYFDCFLGNNLCNRKWKISNCSDVILNFPKMCQKSKLWLKKRSESSKYSGKCHCFAATEQDNRVIVSVFQCLRKQRLNLKFSMLADIPLISRPCFKLKMLKKIAPLAFGNPWKDLHHAVKLVVAISAKFFEVIIHFKSGYVMKRGAAVLLYFAKRGVHWRLIPNAFNTVTNS